MNLVDYTLKNKVISWLVVVLLIVGGSVSFLGLGKLEFPEFPIPQAIVNTAYPGASAEQVEEELTLQLEKVILEIAAVKNITSYNSPGLSQILVELDEKFPVSAHPQAWATLRKKVEDLEPNLPPGAHAPQVIDEFSDVYGVLLNITSSDYSYSELENYADFLKRELIMLDGVAKVSIQGQVAKQVIVELEQSDLFALNLDPNWIFGLLNNQNVVSNAGAMMIGQQSVRFHPTGEYNNLDDLKQLIISPPGQDNLIRLGDIAKVTYQYEETPTNLYRSNSLPAISFGIAFQSSVNVVDVGNAIKQRLAELDSERPIGVTIEYVYDQSAAVDASVNDFLINLLVSVGIVIVVLLVTMGPLSGLIMGAVLLLTILGTFIGMSLLNIEIQIISLGALIIALGMLVDNAIVITEGVLVGLQRGLSKTEAIKEVVSQTQFPLLGATAIAIIAFAPIGLSPDATGDFLGSLFYVLLIALLLSWIFAITLTPFFCDLLFKDQIKNNQQQLTKDPYQSLLFRGYRKILSGALRHRFISLATTLAVLASSIVGFGYVKQAFFPPSNTPIFYIDVWMQEGTDIRATSTTLNDIERQILSIEDVVQVTTVLGMGAQRFLLTYQPEMVYGSYGQLIVETTDLETIEKTLPLLRQQLEDSYPESQFKFKLMALGPAPSANIEARFYGPDPSVLRYLANQAIEIISQEPSAIETRHSWREKTLVVRPQIDTAAARRSGVTKQDIDNTLRMNSSGEVAGIYRQGADLLSILVKAPEANRNNIDRIKDSLVWSSEQSTYIPIKQVVSEFTTEYENSRIVRRNLRRMITVMTDVTPFTDDTPESVRQKLINKIEGIELPEGYTFEWGGEFEQSTMAQENLFSSLPMGYLAMFLITVFLFGTIRQALAIWMTVPLALIGVAFGLLVMGIPFTFTALLGLLSLSGMIIKNGIVLVEQINIEKAKGFSIQDSVTRASVSRMRPVCMAAITTVLGMAPLIFDAFFASMAVTIIFGLAFATVLTLIVLPVIYSLLHRVRFS
ncbi:efflux RND transporter permease subunit [Vibrio comitans]|uniref:Multidrug transporter AcrB n=1 Tax=Vibrio comitans NBRC 102076 TaxID=1219078 RepID=A0A4Y3INU5_9VIBR|nr:efflux RND transporter permease subunit [Vibrio comitans]GEA61169.1 multidrug transporter AcrB [Vibrio comitans NBRC 102076]